MSEGTRGNRSRFLDASRGAAMFLVLLAHFLWIYFDRNRGHTYQQWLGAVGLVAAPTFMILSGTLLGFIYQSRPERFESFRIKLVDRGLFLLTIGHVIISLAYVQISGSLGAAFRSAQILDPVGVAIIIGPWLISRVRPGPRLALAAALVLSPWVVLPLWQPMAPGLLFLRDTLVGGGGFWIYNFPIVPWAGLYLGATTMGQALGTRLSEGDLQAVRRLFLTCGVTGIGSAVLLKGAQQLVKRSGLPQSPEAENLLYQVTLATQKLPPGPAYFLFYGGAGLLLVAAILSLEARGRSPRLLDLTAMIGRNSLFIFLLQEHLYVLWLWTLNPPYTLWWPLIFLATVAVAVSITRWWDRRGLGRWLTVGYGRWWGPRGHAPGATAA